jgi:hypothetical protein
MTFALYAAPSGGIALPTETQTVAVNNGLFNVVLKGAMNLSLLPRVVGRAWASSGGREVKRVRAVVGVDRGNDAVLWAVNAMEEKTTPIERELVSIKVALGLKSLRRQAEWNDRQQT